MQYETRSSNLLKLKYGGKMKERARENYYTLVGIYHLNFPDFPHIRASPNGIIDWGCCDKKLVQIKFPSQIFMMFIEMQKWQKLCYFATHQKM